MKLKEGIWTPSAKVICLDCHGNSFPETKRMNDGSFDFGKYSYSKERWTKMIAEKEMDPENGITKCDKCGCDIQIDFSIATEHNLASTLKGLGIEACMTQTGGMCSAVEITRKGEKTKDGFGPYYLVTYNFDGDNLFMIGRYDNQGDWDESFGESFEMFDDVIDFIIKLDDIVVSEEGDVIAKRVEAIGNDDNTGC